MHWYKLLNIDAIDTPALIMYKKNIIANISLVISMVASPNNLRPHIKTNKTPEVCKIMMQQGITKFKCATIAEAEMLAMIKAPDVLLALQPTGPKIIRLLNLVNTYPDTKFSCITDELNAANNISKLFIANKKVLPVFIDLNVGMNRTGIRPEHAMQLFNIAKNFEGIKIIGLHAYDGHIRSTDTDIAKKQCDKAFANVNALAKEIQLHIAQKLIIVLGGTPTFPYHAQRKNVECSPGTFIFWDWGYKNLMPTMPFVFGALVITRIISIPDSETICTDLGHKSIASENPMPRVYFLNVPGAQHIAHSEEHLILRVPDASVFTIGDVLYGVPIHICPTVALYEKAFVADKKNAVCTWRITARDRSINI